jgi:hypothetical protein
MHCKHKVQNKENKVVKKCKNKYNFMVKYISENYCH